MNGQVTYISEMMAQPQEFFGFLGRYNTFSLLESPLARCCMPVIYIGKTKVKTAA